MNGWCMPKRPRRFWQYHPGAEHVPMWVAVHSNVNAGPNIEVTASSGESWVLDGGDFVIEHACGDVFVLTENEFHQQFDMCPEQARR